MVLRFYTKKLQVISSKNKAMTLVFPILNKIKIQKNHHQAFIFAQNRLKFFVQNLGTITQKNSHSQIVPLNSAKSRSKFCQFSIFTQGCLVPIFTTRGIVAPPANNLIMSVTLIQSFRHLECQNPSIISESIGIPNGSKKQGKK